ncbi:MAG: hypothetical protein DPW16_20260 [Chloroflexi bacterium]|nr:hypothetical protein [Chloroflexota bacterium]
MEKSEFLELFKRQLELAAENAESKLGYKISRVLKIAFYGFGYSGEQLDVETAFDLLWIDETLFYAIVDVAVIDVTSEKTVIFIRVSGHEPCPFEKTWNDLPGNGPFNQLISEKVIKGKF